MHPPESLKQVDKEKLDWLTCDERKAFCTRQSQGGAPMVQHDALELERLLALIRHASGELLNLDMYERWGGGRDPEMNRRMEAGAGVERAKSEAQAKLEELVTQLRRSNPEAISAWVAVHVQLLEDMRKSSDDSTAVFVADEEIEGWKKVQEGKAQFVDENTFYIHVNPTLYTEHFGFGPFDIPAGRQ